MQSDNGPCPLLALANICLQTHLFSIAPGTTQVREDHLMAMLADFVSTLPSNPTLSFHHQREHAISDFLDVLPELAKGMHVNVRFSAPAAFEFTRELAVFDIFPGVRLLHGWLVDPQDARLAATLGTLSYNQVVDELVRTAPDAAPTAHQPLQKDEPPLLAHVPSAPPLEAFEDMSKDSSDDDIVSESEHTAAIRELRPLIVDFLENNPTMLTIYGLTELHAALREDEAAVLFRNSHFYVIRKKRGELFTLVTDVGYLNELNTVWEKLADVTGDSVFYNGCFEQLSDNGLVIGTTTTSRPQDAVQGPHVSIHRRNDGCAPGAAASQRHPLQHHGAWGATSQRASGMTRPGGRKPAKNDKCVIQ
eukprot:GFKZ01015837.1.p1 GENE.GFKZ01015837.1~~GFKZ01015837.1.p1  ORF type:complete len:383 (-),score=52.68 GFKZ01015837.1:137-1225(-)